MAKGIAIHIGVNHVDPAHYGGWDGKLNACEFDANDMEQISTSQGFTAIKLLSPQATRQAVIDAINAAAAQLTGEDILLISYSGHGGQVPDMSGDEKDFKDETWCLYDGQLIDDELRQLWTNLPEGARVLVISDSCHSGSVIKTAINVGVTYSKAIPRFMPDEIVVRTYMNNKDFYDSLVKEGSAGEIGATVRLISGCQDNQYSYDGTFNGAFTAALKQVWSNGSFKGDYALFHQQIQNKLPAYQSPNHFVYGCPNADYDQEKPFKV